MSYMEKVVKGFFIVLIFNMLAAAIGYIYRIVMARNLNIADYGLFFSLYAFFWLLSYFRDFGAATALAKFIPQFAVKKDKKSIILGIKTVYLFDFILTLIIGVIVILSAGVLAKYYFKIDNATTYIILFFIVFLLKMFTDIARLILQGEQRMFSYSLVYFIENTIILTFLGITFFFTHSVYFVFLAFVAAYLIMAVLSIILVSRNKTLFEDKKNFSTPLLKKFLKFGFPLCLAGFASMIYLYTDTLVLTYFRPLAEVGIYTALVSLAMLINFIGTSLGDVLLPLFSEVIAKKQHHILRDNIIKGYRYLFFIIVPIGIVMFLFSGFFLKIFFGPEYVAGQTALSILIIGVMFFILSSISNQILITHNRTALITKIGVITAVINLILNIIFIKHYGMIAAACTSLIAYFVFFYLSAYYAQKILKKKFIPYGAWIKTLIAGTVFAVLLIFISNRTTFNVYINHAIALGIAGAVYTIICLLLKVIKIEEFKQIINALLKK